MSATRIKWAELIKQVMLTVYEQDDTYLGMDFEKEAHAIIKAKIGAWTITELEDFIINEVDKCKNSNCICNGRR